MDIQKWHWYRITLVLIVPVMLVAGTALVIVDEVKGIEFTHEMGYSFIIGALAALPFVLAELRKERRKRTRARHKKDQLAGLRCRQMVDQKELCD